MENVIFKNHLISENKSLQIIIFEGCEVGFLSSRIKNYFAGVEETFLIPNVNYGIDGNGFGDLKPFYSLSDAVCYIKNNFNEVVKIFNNADFD